MTAAPTLATQAAAVEAEHAADLPTALMIAIGALGVALVLATAGWLRSARRAAREEAAAGAAQTETRRVEQRFRDTLESIDAGVAVFDADLRILFHNESFLPIARPRIGRLDGMTRDEILAAVNQVADAIAERCDVAAVLADIEAHLASGSSAPIEVTVTGRRWLRISQQITTEGGRVITTTDITALKHTEQRLRRAIESTSDSFVLWDAEDRLVICNERFLHDYPSLRAVGEIRGRTYEELVRLAAQAGAARDSMDAETWIAERLRSQRMPASDPTEQLLADGRWIRISKQRTPDGGLVSIGTDITATKRAEQLLRDAIEAIDAGVGLIDAEDRLILHNNAFLPVFRREVGPLTGLTIQAIAQRQHAVFGALQPDYDIHAVISRVLESYRDPAAAPFEFEGPLGGWYRFRARPFGTGHVVFTFTDITDLKRKEDDLRRSQTELQRSIGQIEEARRRLEEQAAALADLAKEAANARDVAEAANRAKSQFLAMISHEIRTPMNGVIGMIDLMVAAGLSRKQQEYAEVAIDSANALLAIINDVLDLSKLEEGRIELDPSVFVLEDLIGSILGLLRPKASLKGLPLLCRIAPGVPARIIADAGRVKQVLFNLVGNAIKFTDQGEISVEVAVRSRDTKQAVLAISVRDAGIGIAPEARDRLFQRFSQADASINRRFGGTGLGLAICKQLVELMGGSIDVASDPGHGSVFSFTLPCGIVTLPAEEVAAATVEEPASRALSGHVLVAEDNRINRQVIAGLLDRLGVIHDMVADGEAAVGAAATGRYDAILMDIQMPRLDGIAATRAIRRMAGPQGRVPIIALTAHAMDDHRRECREAGMTDFVTKPIKPEALLDALVRVSGQAAAPRHDPPSSVEFVLRPHGAASSEPAGEADLQALVGRIDRLSTGTEG